MFCPNCGKEIQTNALFCGYCGFKVVDMAQPQVQPSIGVAPAQPAQPQTPAVQPTQPVQQPYQAQQQFQPIDDNSTLITVIKIFLIIGCVAQGWLIIPLAWCLPITISCFKKLNAGIPIGTGMKVCTLIFVSLVSGICLLCMKDEQSA